MQAIVTLRGEHASLDIEGAARSINIVRAEDGNGSDVSVRFGSIPAAIASQALEGGFHSAVVTAGNVVATFDIVKCAWNPVEATLDISGGEGAGAWNTARISLSVPRSMPDRDAAMRVAGSIGLPVIGDDSAVLPRVPRTFACLWRDAMRQCFGARWAVTASGVVVGGTAATLPLEDGCVLESLSRSRLSDGSEDIESVVSMPLTPCDVGAAVSGTIGDVPISGRVVRVEHSITYAGQRTTVTVKR